MEKETADNLQNSPDREALKTEEIIKNNVDFSLVKIKVEKISKERDSGVDEWSPVRVEPDSLIISVESNSESMRYTVSSNSIFSPTFRPNQQEDAHEFLQCFLNKLESCCYNLEPQDNIVKEAFGGRLVSMLRCCNCCHLSVTHEPLIDLSLEIVDVDSVPEALESFTKIEKIEFSCEMCKTQGPFEKQFLIDRAHSVATLCLKRFKNDRFVVQEVDKHVSFPLELDMLHYTNKINNEEMKYDLYAVIVHSGFSFSSGHYYSFIRCNPNKWYKFNDEQVHWVHQDLVLVE
uniref:Ubiquitin carboxyl-terminal hydrolase n=1 Tax=Solanum tuberosum TaxID=4113 RepID=M1DRA8_SOLTU